MNLMPSEQKNMKDELLAKIKAGEVTMRPKIHFTLKAVALVAVAFAVLVVSILIFNFIFFSIRIAGHESLLGFGWEGLLRFLFFFPWILLAIDLSLIVVLEWLLRQFRFGYHTPVLYLLGGIVVVSVSAGMIIDRGTSFNDALVTRAGRHQLPPPINGWYEPTRHFPRPESGICRRCTILAIDGNVLVVAPENAIGTTTLTIVLPKNGPHATTSRLSVGDTVMIAGDLRGGTLYAFGVRVIR